MNTIRFFANRCEFVPCDDDSVGSIFLQDATTREYLSLSRRLEGARGPVEIERDDQQWVSRNGVANCVVSRNALAITVPPESLFELGVGQWEISYVLSKEEFKLLVSAIMNIFADTSTVLRIVDA